MIFVPSEIYVRHSQYITKDNRYKHFYQENIDPFIPIRFIQLVGVSNPAPKYIEEVATDFKSKNTAQMVLYLEKVDRGIPLSPLLPLCFIHHI